MLSIETTYTRGNLLYIADQNKFYILSVGHILLLLFFWKHLKKLSIDKKISKFGPKITRKCEKNKDNAMGFVIRIEAIRALVVPFTTGQNYTKKLPLKYEKKS